MSRVCPRFAAQSRKALKTDAQSREETKCRESQEIPTPGLCLFTAMSSTRPRPRPRPPPCSKDQVSATLAPSLKAEADNFAANTMTTSVASALQKLLPSSLPPSLSSRPGNLYQVLSRYSKDGVGQRVHQVRWGSKGIEDCYWEVTRTRLKLGGKHGKAWGKLIWKGALTFYRGGSQDEN